MTRIREDHGIFASWTLIDICCLLGISTCCYRLALILRFYLIDTSASKKMILRTICIRSLPWGIVVDSCGVCCCRTTAIVAAATSALDYEVACVWGTNWSACSSRQSRSGEKWPHLARGACGSTFRFQILSGRRYTVFSACWLPFLGYACGLSHCWCSTRGACRGTFPYSGATFRSFCKRRWNAMPPSSDTSARHPRGMLRNRLGPWLLLNLCSLHKFRIGSPTGNLKVPFHRCSTLFRLNFHHRFPLHSGLLQ